MLPSFDPNPLLLILSSLALEALDHLDRLVALHRAEEPGTPQVPAQAFVDHVDHHPLGGSAPRPAARPARLRLLRSKQFPRSQPPKDEPCPLRSRGRPLPDQRLRGLVRRACDPHHAIRRPSSSPHARGGSDGLEPRAPHHPERTAAATASSRRTVPRTRHPASRAARPASMSTSARTGSSAASANHPHVRAG